jgi:curli biogenesis system outer membrane secretion channel CsgG
MHRAIVLGLLLTLTAACGGKTVRKEETVAEPEKAYPPKPMEQRKRIAVMTFDDRSQYGKGKLGNAAADVLTGMLVRTQQFRVITRQQLAKVLEEQKLGGSGIVDAATAPQVGKVIGVEYIVVGVVTRFGMRQSSGNYVVTRSKRQEASCTVEVSLIDATTGEILYSEPGEGFAEREYTKVLGAGESGGHDQTLAEDSLRASVATMIDNLIKHAP